MINTTPIQVDNFSQTTIANDQSHNELRKIAFDFQVTSGKYHEITSLLYQNNFRVTLPNQNTIFPCQILNYSTSITNLYEKGNVGTFHLELVEKNEEHS